LKEFFTIDFREMQQISVGIDLMLHGILSILQLGWAPLCQIGFVNCIAELLA
jgi:hypothetical protein